MINFLAMETNGDTAFIVGVGGAMIVICMMMILSLVFIIFGKIMAKDLRLKKVAKPAPQKAADSTEAPVVLKGKLSANTVAAISAAIYQYMDEAHEDENAIITIDRAAKSYSPWSSKIYVTNRGVFKGARR